MRWCSGFPGPRSETGEDMAEFHLHGGRAVVAATLAALAAVPGLTPAGPGAFTRQAFDNGKLDLTAAEAIADLVEAETAAQRRQALRQMDGALARLYEGWRADLLMLLARLEAAIDFPEEDLPANLAALNLQGICRLRKEIEDHLGDRRGERLRDGLSIALLGAPNAGKSSILNYLAGREAAIVSARAGTTRDVIEVHLDIAGFPVVLADTAGLREVTRRDRGRRRAPRPGPGRACRSEADRHRRRGLAGIDPASAALVDENSLVLISKVDLNAAIPLSPLVAGRPALPVSVVTGWGTDPLLQALEAEVAQRMSLTEAPALTRLRHRQALEECLACLGRAQDGRAARAPGRGSAPGDPGAGPDHRTGGCGGDPGPDLQGVLYRQVEVFVDLHSGLTITTQLQPRGWTAPQACFCRESVGVLVALPPSGPVSDLLLQAIAVTVICSAD